MPIQIIRNDITKMRVDAIVTTGNKYLRGGSGVNGAIHKAAGPLLEIAAQKLGGCNIGEAKITRGYALPCRYMSSTPSAPSGIARRRSVPSWPPAIPSR